MTRFDTRALCRALDAQRQARAMSWRQVSDEIGLSAATLARTEHGGRLEVDGMLTMVAWLGRSVESFARRSND